MELNGVWRALPATDDLRRNGVGVNVDDSAWHKIEVPGHWQTSPPFNDADGPILYRTQFNAAPPGQHERRWLTLDGIFYQADAWLDGAYLGDPEGYFFPQSYDITDLSRLDEEHVVAVEVACSPDTDYRSRRNITGSLQPADSPEGWNPGGIWQPVRVHTTGPARLDRLRVLCRDANQYRAHLLITARVDVDTSRRVTLRTSVDGVVQFESQQQLAAGKNDVAWNLDIADPDLWWPYQMGDQPLSDVTVEVLVDGAASDGATRRTGLREVGWRNWTCSINGERLFLKGANLMPTRLALAEATDAECWLDIELARALDLNMVRVHGHVARTATYDAADELGVLIMQDFPLQGEYPRSIRTAAQRQARAMVDVLGHHPSIVHWNSHSDAGATAPGWHDESTKSWRSAIAHQLPKWDRSLLDRSIKATIEDCDPTRAVESSSGALPRLPSLGGSDSHSYFGWFQGQLTDLAAVARQAPNLLKFVAEFGAEAAPTNLRTLARAAGDSRWPHLDWALLEQRLNLSKAAFDRHVPPEDYDNEYDWTIATQLYQAQVLQYQIELLRRMKYRPTGGFAFYCLNDSRPAVSFSILDDQRHPKLAYDVVKTSCAPVMAVADPMPTRAAPGESVAADLWVINDRRFPLTDLRVEVWLDDTAPIAAFVGDIGADAAVKVGAFDFIMPSTPVTCSLSLVGHGPDGIQVDTTNPYRVTPVNR